MFFFFAINGFWFLIGILKISLEQNHFYDSAKIQITNGNETLFLKIARRNKSFKKLLECK
ncbi:hypothetical protein APS56_02435 [Pseudalgibacter alginicilyticus]|uniref:Uncharacterized protein n=1 Tax=Pseudalgibacter alginicilyticus TaxID=1736674 RepID=A0A0P0D5Y0_9FLAO|nr:hypothetical protein APS56_02435 [Pseudalgibacter alginicilyticus]